MGTSATIARKNTDGTITAIRCNYDGYVEHVGVLLARHYTTPEAIGGLFKLLEIRSLDETPETTEAYGRDFRTVSFYPKAYDGIVQLRRSFCADFGASYLYYHDGDKWLVCQSDRNSLFKELDEVIAGIINK
jgi:hypothetical protein